MAKNNGIHTLDGSFGNMTTYELRGIDRPVLDIVYRKEETRSMPVVANTEFPVTHNTSWHSWERGNDAADVS